MKHLKKIVPIFMFVIVFFSCKSEPKEQTTNSQTNAVDSTKVEAVENKKLLSISFDLASTEEGTFQFQFTNNEYPKQSKKVFKSLKKSEAPYLLEANYSLESNDFPSKVSVILGHETPKDLLINSITLKSYGNTIEIDGSKITDYFIPNAYINYKPESQTLQTVKVKNGHLPIMILNKKAIDSLLY